MKKQRKGIRLACNCGLLLVLSGLALGGVLLSSMESRSDLIPVGQAAPDFTAETSNGGMVHLLDLRGQKRVVLVFYPGDFTPVCTGQLCAFRDNWQALQAENTVVYGVNPANREKHARFAAKYQLPFQLIADARGDIARRYGCRALFGIMKRTVYIIDRQGRIAWAKRGNPAPDEILQALHSLHDSPTS